MDTSGQANQTRLDYQEAIQKKHRAASFWHADQYNREKEQAYWQAVRECDTAFTAYMNEEVQTIRSRNNGN